MKKSVGICCFYGDWSLEEKFVLAKEAGFTGFELDLSEDGPVNMMSSANDLKGVRSLAEKFGLELSGLMSFLYWGANAASANPAIRKKAAALLNRQIECASLLGIDTILAVPGAVGADFIPDAEVVAYDVAYERASDFIRAALPAAEKAGVTIGIENVWNKFLLSQLEMRTFVDQFGSAHVGVYFDVANTLAFGYPEHWIDILGSRIKRVHFKDFRRKVATVDGFCDLLSGDVNWPAVMSGLRKGGYDGWITAEMIPPVPFYKHAPGVLIHTTSRAMDAIFAL